MRCFIQRSAALQAMASGKLFLDPAGIDTAACDRCAAVDLDPLQVLEQMLPGMPLAEAVPVLAHLLRERAHRRRHGSILRNLWRSSSIAASVDKVEVRGCH